MEEKKQPAGHAPVEWTRRHRPRPAIERRSTVPDSPFLACGGIHLQGGRKGGRYPRLPCPHDRTACLAIRRDRERDAESARRACSRYSTRAVLDWVRFTGRRGVGAARAGGRARTTTSGQTRGPGTGLLTWGCRASSRSSLPHVERRRVAVGAGARHATHCFSMCCPKCPAS
ncbi:hypothetical protein BS78_01G416100 [Paspalum vaginatum]|nr:hypothetical protein BS78_01G416100 [Paspalum vaginatum]